MMKKTVIALVCLILTTGAAMAQKAFTFGPKIGIDYTHQLGKNSLIIISADEDVGFGDSQIYCGV